MEAPLVTPLVVPSFSSRGFPQERRRLKGVTKNHFREYAENFEAFLVSAFDIHFGYIDEADIPSERTVFVDSGGYESREWEDDSAIYLKKLAHADEPWTEDMMVATIKRLPDDPRFIYVSYDSESDVNAQITRAIAQLAHFAKARKSVLIKEEPIGGEGSDNMAQLSDTLAKLPALAEQLRLFDVIGVTEKSLGSSYYERLFNLAAVRAILDRARISSPIHVFGALDPISARVYSLAGADIFDGLTWLRFAYRDDQCVYLGNDIMLQSELSEPHSAARDAVYARNYLELTQLQRELREYRSTSNPDVLKLDRKLKGRAQKALAEIRASDPFRRVLGE